MAEDTNKYWIGEHIILQAAVSPQTFQEASKALAAVKLDVLSEGVLASGAVRPCLNLNLPTTQAQAV